MNKSILPLTVGLLIAVVSGWIHGYTVDRWGVPADVVAVAQRIENLPLEVDGWESKQGADLGEQTRHLAGAEGYFSRQYVLPGTGISVNATALCGRPGPISLHVPTVCFTNSGMSQLAREVRVRLPSDTEGPNNFWMAEYEPPQSSPGPTIRTFWSWSTDARNWSVPEDPRFEFAREPYLYRIYFSIPAGVFDEGPTEDGKPSPYQQRVDEFIGDFLAQFAGLANTEQPAGTEPSADATEKPQE